MAVRHLIGILAVVTTACAGGDTSGPTTPTTSATTVTSTTTTPPAVEESIVIHGIAVGNGEPAIGLLDSATGAVTQLVDPLLVAEGAGHLFLDPSTNLIYYARSATSCSNEIVTLDVATGNQEVVASGVNPVVSPDGRYLAYSIDPTCRAHDDVRVRDLASGKERTWVSELDESSELPAIVTSLDWSPNGEQLVVELLLEDGTDIRLIDATTDGGTIFDAPRLTPLGAMWASPMFLDDGSIVVVATTPETEARFSLAVVNPATSESSELLWLPGPARVVDVHPTSGQILFTTIASHFDVDLWRFDGSTASLVIAGVSDAVWMPSHGAPVARS